MAPQHPKKAKMMTKMAIAIKMYTAETKAWISTSSELCSTNAIRDEESINAKIPAPSTMQPTICRKTTT